MKKSILNLGKTLSKAEQKSINGGVNTDEGVDCGPGTVECSCHGHSFCVLSSSICEIQCGFLE